MSLKLRLAVLVFLIVYPLDQGTKQWVVSNLTPFNHWVPLESLEGFFRITHSRNPGAALGLFPGTPVAVFIGLTVLAIGLIVSFFRRIEPDDRISAVALGMILGGAIGNLSDRVFRGAVVDFLQFDLVLFTFPDFNVADSSIVVGVALLLRDLVFPHARPTAEPEAEA